MNICVFCSAYSLDDRYSAPAAEFARLLGEGGHTLVWGGSNAGGKLVGIMVEMLKHKGYVGADELVVTADLAERKRELASRADAIVVLVGGLGTMDEVTEVVELKKHGMFDKPVVVLDTEGFYSGLRTQLERMDAEGFLPRPLTELITFADTPAEVFAQLKA